MSPSPHAAVGVIIVAAGLGTRLGAGRPKALVEIAGVAMVVHAVRRASAAAVGQVVVVAPADHRAAFVALLPQDVAVVSGGAERTDSVAAGLAALPARVEVVLVHDAARALAPAGLFDRVVDAVRSGYDAVVPGLQVVDTIKQVDAGGHVLGTPERAGLRAIQTPQGFTRAALERAHTCGAQATDDAALVERLGGTVRVIDGDPLAFKVTTPPDLEAAERLAAAKLGPVLIVLRGLPGVGKTALSRALAQRLPLAHVRVDTIEATMVRAGLAEEITGPEGYAIAYRVAGDQLAHGLSVVADTVNPLAETREGWRQVAQAHAARLLEVELVCSDTRVHERRVSERVSDIPGLTVPTWSAVQQRAYHPWTPDLRLDSATVSPDELASAVLGRLRGAWHDATRD